MKEKQIFLEILRVLIVLSCCFPLKGFGQQELPVFVIDGIKPIENIDRSYIHYWTDETGKVDIDYILNNGEKIPFRKLKTQLPNTQEVHWCKLKIQNKLRDSFVVKDWFFDIGNADYADVYFVNDENKIMDHHLTGELIPKHKKSIQTKSFRERIKFSLQTNEPRVVYIRLQRVSGFQPKFSPGIYQQDYFERPGFLRVQPRRYLFFGMLFSFMFFSLFIFFATSDSAFLYFSLFLVGMTGFLANAFFFFWGDTFFFDNHPESVMLADYFFVTLMNVMYLMFIREFINSQHHFPKWDRIARLTILVNLLLLPIAWGIYFFTLEEFLIAKIILPVILVSYLMILTLTVQIINRGLRNIVNLFMVIAVLCFVIAVAVNAVYILQGNNIHRTLTMILITANVIAFALGLAYRFHNQQEEKGRMERLKDLDRVKSRLYQNITHEFRTPLTVIQGITHQFSEEETVIRSPKLRKGVEMIARNGRSLLKLVNNMLDMARLEKGEMRLDLNRGDIVVYLRYLVESIEPYANSKNIRLQFLSKLEKAEMDFDEEKVRRIFYNLISNAIKFTASGGRVKLIVDEEIANARNYIRIIVKDNGIGIPAENLPHIFDRFYRADNVPQKEGEGTGIGLALAKQLITLMEGELNMKSKVGEGTEITVRLPINRRSKQNSNSRSTNMQAILEGEFSGVKNEKEASGSDIGISLGAKNKPLLLVVEDNWDVLEYLKSILLDDFRIETALDGQKGIERAVKILPDVIISDVVMPGKSGYELCDELKADPQTQHIPIMLLTAKGTPEDRIKGFRYGADAYLVKPFYKEEMLVRLKNMLESRNLAGIGSGGLAISKIIENLTSDKDKEFLQTLTDYILENISNEKMDVAHLQRAVNMSRPQLHRRLKALTNMSASQFRKSIRLQAAKQILEEGNMNVSEVAYKVGYKYPANFSKDFKEMFGVTPVSI